MRQTTLFPLYRIARFHQVYVICLMAFLWALSGNSTCLRAQSQDLQRDTLNVLAVQPFQLQKWIDISSFKLRTETAILDTSFYQLNAVQGMLWLKKKPETSFIIAEYRVFAFGLKAQYALRSLPVVRADSTLLAPIQEADINPEPKGVNPFEGTNLQRNGSITRGVTVGNRRDATIESGFRMQLSGQIVDGVQLSAVLTDENTPIQPEGTTQRLNEIDRVLIQLQSKQVQLNLGDFDLSVSNSYFAQFNRKLQGVSLQYELPDPKNNSLGKVKVQIAGATSRGIYQTQILVAQEGVQGPYRLQGKQGEQFIIVIAGSEKVYLNGQLLTRGESEDYVIDYASGEITFTAQNLMTSAKRLSVEFEYTTNRFTRSLLGTTATAELWQKKQGEAGRLQIYSNVLREADAASFDEELGLSAADLAILETAGDDPLQAITDGAKRVAFDAEAPYTQYVKKQMIPQGSQTPVEIFVPISQLSEQNEVYQVRFSRVLQGEGDYRRVGSAVNGIVYEYVGKSQGDYVPFRVLPRPQAQNLVSIGSILRPFSSIEIYGEWAQSQIDKNRLSKVNDENNQGFGYKTGLRLQPIPLNSHLYWSSEAQLSRRSSYFSTFDRTRPVEFGRQWNLGNITPNKDTNTSTMISDSGTENAVNGANEQMFEVKMRLGYAKHSFVEAQFGKIGYDTQFSANRKAVNLQVLPEKSPQIRYTLESIQSRDSTQTQTATVNEHLKGNVKGNWLKQDFNIRYRKGNISFIHENRRMETETAQLSAQLSDASFAFWEVKPAFLFEGSRINANSGIEYRADQQADAGEMHEEARAWTWRTSFDWKPFRHFQTSGDVGLRQKVFSAYFKEKYPENGQIQDAKAALLKWNGIFTPFKRAIEMRWQYEALTEKAPILQELYREVQRGQGQFQWIDANADGLRQVDEFVPAVSRFDGNYVRLLVPSDVLKPVVNVEARWRFVLDPEKIWMSSPENKLPNWKAKLAKWSSQTLLEVAEKSEEKEVTRLYLLDKSALQNAATTMNGRFRMNQELFFARSNPRYGGTASFSHLSSLNRLAAGIENRRLQRWNLEMRWKPDTNLLTKLNVTQETNRQQSEQFSSRNYNIRTQSLGPECTLFALENRLNLTLSMILARKIDDATTIPQEATVLRAPVSIRFVQAGKWQVVANVEFANIKTLGDATGLAGFELTDGRGVGKSWLWNTSMDYTLSRLLRASLFYDGRAPADAPVLHTIRAQISATF